VIGEVSGILQRRRREAGGAPTPITFERRPSTRFRYDFWPSTTSEDAQKRGEGEEVEEGGEGPPPYRNLVTNCGGIGGLRRSISHAGDDLLLGKRRGNEEEG
jgi:hypothetical protein